MVEATSKRKITVTGLKWAPPIVHGLVRDLRVRWALEEAGVPYEMRLVGPDDQKTERYRKLQPFGQIPVYEEDGLEIFESGAIVQHIAERSEALMPPDAQGRARATAWMFSAINSIEPAVSRMFEVDFAGPDADWAKARRPAVLAMTEKRLDDLSTWLGERAYLEDRFTAGDLLMTTVLRIVRHTELVKARKNLEAYRLRCEARPAFQRALAAHLKAFEENAPPDPR
jgi:glutathione S-transferase